MANQGNATQSAHAAPRCGAYARTTGHPRKAPAIRDALRCRMHGGKAGRKATHGRYTRAAIAERRKFREALRVLRKLIDVAG